MTPASSARSNERKRAHRCCGSQDTLPWSQVDDAYLLHTWCSGGAKDHYSSLGTGSPQVPGPPFLLSAADTSYPTPIIGSWEGQVRGGSESVVTLPDPPLAGGWSLSPGQDRHLGPWPPSPNLSRLGAWRGCEMGVRQAQV